MTGGENPVIAPENVSKLLKIFKNYLIFNIFYIIYANLIFINLKLSIL